MSHVFLLLMEQEKSVARTIRAISEIFPCIIRPNDMKTVLNNLNSFKHLGREKEMEDFIQRCSEPFTMFTAICETEREQSEVTAADNSIPMDVDKEVEELKRTKNEEKITKKDGKTYSIDMRMMIYDAIVNQVPTQNIPSLIEK
ncbi:hypothetical protein LSAT2_004827, partial [Lamellibrachia satsuma]